MAATYIYPSSKTEKFIEKARNVHGDFYNYSLVDYKYSQTKVTIICPKHGEFEQIPNSHLSGQGCPKCGNERIGESRKSNTKNFIEKSRNVHGDFYDYSLVNYKTDDTKVTIICPDHGEFEKKPNSHLGGQGCPGCSGKKKLNTKDFIERAKEVHDDFFDYSLVECKNNATKITIICPVHGEFEQIPHNHLGGQGCLKCYNERRSESQRSNTKDFIKRAKEVHGHDKYDYSLVEYKTNKTKVTIICPEHGEFEQRPYSHLNGRGCPKCYNERSKGLFKKKFLEDNPERAKENCIFYIIQLFDDEESFIKCGITQRTIQKRFCVLNEYDYEIVDSFETTLEHAIDLEYYLVEKFEKYRPRNRFYGHTECFELSELENIQNIFNHLFQIAS